MIPTEAGHRSLGCTERNVVTATMNCILGLRRPPPKCLRLLPRPIYHVSAHRTCDFSAGAGPAVSALEHCLYVRIGNRERLLGWLNRES